MLNMALLNIMGGAGGGVPDTSPYNIFGLFSPCIAGLENLHFPHTTIIWNKYLTTFTTSVRCDDNDAHWVAYGVGGSPTICAVNTDRVRFEGHAAGANSYLQAFGISTQRIGALSRLRMGFAFIDTKFIEQNYAADIEAGRYNSLIAGYANYWEYLKPINGRMLNSTTSLLSDYLGGSVWQCGVGIMTDGLPARKAVYFPIAARSFSIDGVQQNIDNWAMTIVPVRGITNYPKNEFSNSMVYGFMQLEYPQQIGGTLAYSFGVAADSTCVPKNSVAKCGGKMTGAQVMNPEFPNKLFGGFAAFDLDLFLRPFIRAGLLRSYADATNVYNKLSSLLLNLSQVQEGAPTYVTGSARAFQSNENLWQGIFDNWLEQPYKDIFKELGASEEYYPKWLMTNYPQQANFHSILGCGRSYDAGAAMNAAIYSMMESCAVFKALSTFPDDFPVDLPALVLNT